MAWRNKLCYFSTFPEQNGILNVRDRGAEREWGPICQFGAEQKTWRHKGRHVISRGFEPINVDRLIRELLIVKRGGGYPVGGEPYFEGRASGAGFGVGGGISKLRDRHTSENSDLGRLVCSTRVKSCQPC